MGLAWCGRVFETPPALNRKGENPMLTMMLIVTVAVNLIVTPNVQTRQTFGDNLNNKVVAAAGATPSGVCDIAQAIGGVR